MPGQPRTRWEKKLLFWVAGLLLLSLGFGQLIMSSFREEEKQLRSSIRETVQNQFPQQAEDYSKTLGLFPYPPETPSHQTTIRTDRDAVVLVHGLDDPGKVWSSLAPALVVAHFNVWQMKYPNDQPIRESAWLFFETLKQLKDEGINSVSLVAHSMGGLVSREMLSNPTLDYSGFVQQGVVPDIVSLVMVGTPNHGSQMARFSLFSEIRDQSVRLMQKEASWLVPILDGGGEAKIDLLPNSKFLTELNARPHPAGVDMLVIAGTTTPWTEEDLRDLTRKLNSETLEQHRAWIKTLEKSLASMTRGLGDGLVSVESARIQGVPLELVSGTHLSMIRNVMTNDERTPPAVPIIVKYLEHSNDGSNQNSESR